MAVFDNELATAYEELAAATRKVADLLHRETEHADCHNSLSHILPKSGAGSHELYRSADNFRTIAEQIRSL